jgi:hypothetical protein
MMGSNSETFGRVLRCVGNDRRGPDGNGNREDDSEYAGHLSLHPGVLIAMPNRPLGFVVTRPWARSVAFRRWGVVVDRHASSGEIENDRGKPLKADAHRPTKDEG